MNILFLIASLALAGEGINPEDVGSPSGVATAPTYMDGFCFYLDSDRDSYLCAAVDDAIDLIAGSNGTILIGDAAGAAFLAFGGRAVTDAGLKLVSGEVHARTGDDAAFANLKGLDVESGTTMTVGSTLTAGSNVHANGNVRSGAVGVIYHNGRTQFSSPTTDGVELITNAAGTTGAALDFTVANQMSVLNLAESAPAALRAGTLVIVTPNGALSTRIAAVEVLTFPGGGAATQVTSGLIPAGATLESITSRVQTTGTTCTSVDLGDGSDVDLYGATLSVTAAATSGNPNVTASFANPIVGGGEVTVTANGGNCVDLVIEITANYVISTSATGP